MTVSVKTRVRGGLAAAAFICAGIAAGLFPLAGTAHAQQSATMTETNATAPGEACVFQAPTGADKTNHRITLIGHIGWGYKIPGTDQYIYGATEGIDGSYPFGAPAVTWHEQGDRAKMFAAFYSGHDTHPDYYDAAKCTTTKNSSVDAANEAVRVVEGKRYDLLGANCMNDSYDILTAYGAELPSPKTPWLWLPNKWFESIGWEKTALNPSPGTPSNPPPGSSPSPASTTWYPCPNDSSHCPIGGVHREDGGQEPIRNSPSVSAPVIGWVPNNTSIEIGCQITGDSAWSDLQPGNVFDTSHPYQTNVWNRIGSGANLGGYISDAWVYTGTSEMVASQC
jgi:hypothetical protein